MKKELNFGDITSFAFENGFKNFFPILGCIILWILTIWIPYINVGTTIAMATLPVALSRGETISPVEIFDESYRKYMGEFFLVNGLKNLIIFPALMFMIVPGIIMIISYFFSTMIVVDKGRSAPEAMKMSLEATDGYKWIIFFWFLFSVILSFIPVIGSVISLAGMGYIYGQLTSDISKKDDDPIAFVQKKIKDLDKKIEKAVSDNIPKKKENEKIEKIVELPKSQPQVIKNPVVEMKEKYKNEFDSGSGLFWAIPDRIELKCRKDAIETGRTINIDGYVWRFPNKDELITAKNLIEKELEEIDGFWIAGEEDDKANVYYFKTGEIVLENKDQKHFSIFTVATL